MKKELELYYPEIPDKSIHVTGTPQFEFYQDEKNIMDRAFFYKTYNLDPDKKIICFSGDDTKTSPDDPAYLKDIAEEIIKANLQNKYQILLRKCPIDFSGRFDAVVNQYKDLIKEAPPLWHFNTSNQWSAVYPSQEDVKLLVSTVFYSDIVVNVGSTMAFDFAMFNKPCVFINYDQHNKKEVNWSVKTIYQFQHFRSMPTQEAVYWWDRKEDIVALLENATFNASMNDWKETILSAHTNVQAAIKQQLI